MRQIKTAQLALGAHYFIVILTYLLWLCAFKSEIANKKDTETHKQTRSNTLAAAFVGDNWLIPDD